MRRVIICAALAFVALAARDPYREQRESMVNHSIESRGITDPEILRAMRETPRHLFVPEPMRSRSYDDSPLPIGYGQTISQPYIVAFMTDKLDVESSHKVLEIGTGSGYQAAVLAPLVEHLYTVEIVPELAASAKLTLASYKNVTVRHGDGYKGWPEEAPFDRIILTAAPPSLPQSLVDQLKPGGKLLAPVGASPWSQELVLVEKSEDGKVRERSVLPVVFVPMVPGKE
jgi:protein-L-isoaspartate(D-aspartate) O-methyltransferase